MKSKIILIWKKYISLDNILGAVAIVFALGGTIPLVAYSVAFIKAGRYTGLDWNTMDPAVGGQFGDYVGGVVGTLFGGATVILIYMTYTSQKKELRATIEIGRQQSITAQKQRFESHFAKPMVNVVTE